MDNNMKKDFQKVVKMFRDSLPDVEALCLNFETRKWEMMMVRPEHPKAMMTNAQIKNGTATINCGRANGKSNETYAIDMMSFEPFKVWCESYGIKTVKCEVNSDNCRQVRVTF